MEEAFEAVLKYIESKGHDIADYEYKGFKKLYNTMIKPKENSKLIKSLRQAKKTSGLDQIPRKPGKRDVPPKTPRNSPVGSEDSEGDWRAEGGTRRNPATLPNLPQGAQMSNPHQAGAEVPVIPPPRKVAKIHPDYFTVELPYVQRLYTSTEEAFQFTNDEPFAIIRLNSIYDPLKRVFAGKSPAVDAALQSERQPQGFNIWKSHFKYYRVLKAMVKLTWVSRRHNNLTDDDPFQETYVVGFELVDEDHAISNTTDMFLMTKRAKRDFLAPPNAIIAFNSSGFTQGTFASHNSAVQQEYVYYPKDWVHHVEELGVEERWTPIGENPAVDHDMCLRCMHLGASIVNSAPDDIAGLPSRQTESIGCLVQITYQVQFREQTDSFIKTFNTETATAEDAP